MRVRSSLAALGFLATLVAVAPPALAEQVARPKTYGTQDQIILTLGPCDATNRDLAAPFQVFACDFLTAGQPNTFNTAVAGFPIHLPEGALLEEVDFYYYDTVIGSEPGFSLIRIGQGPGENILNTNLPTWDSGQNNASFPINPAHEIHNEGFVYVLNFAADTVDATHYQGLYNITIRYRLQVSPPPAVATFNDVPTGHPFFQFVEALASSGITAGCGYIHFCPDQALSRGQMAVFLSKALGLHFVTPQQ